MTHLQRVGSLCFALLCSASLVACGQQERNLGLLDSKAAEQPVKDPERQRLEELQLIHLLDNSGNPYVTDGERLTWALESEFCPPVADFATCTTTECVSCQDSIKNRRHGLCLIQTLEMVAALRGPLHLSSFYDLHSALIEGSFTLPPQSPEAVAGILNVAHDRIGNSGYSFLETPDYACSWNAEAIVANDGVSRLGDIAEQTMADWFNAGLRITDAAVDAILATSDAQRSASPTPALGAARSISGAALSRAQAAHLLVGGADGILGSTTTPFCTGAELSSPQRAALTALRKAAPDPADVANKSLNIQRFLNDSLASLSTGSIRVRLAILDGRYNASDGTTRFASTEAYTGLGESDFVAARNYLAEEFGAFARSTATFTPALSSSAANQPASVYWYAATRTPPVPPPPEYYGAIAKYDNWLGYDLAHFRDRWLDLIVGTANSNSKDNETPALYAIATAPLRYISSIYSRTQQLVFSWSGSTVTYTVGPGIGTGTTGERLRIVRGLTPLLCATIGKVDGVPCTGTGATDFTSANVSLLLTGGNSVSGSSSNTTFTAVDKVPRFVVRQKAGFAQDVPGGFEYFGSFMQDDVWLAYGSMEPVTRDLDRRAGELLAPDPSWCARPQLDCDGARFDERMPLENELSDDHDGVESSWERYLELARQAATEADSLGSQYILAGLDADRAQETAELRDSDNQQRFLTRAETELENVQAICGTAIDTAALLGKIGGNGGRLAKAPTCSPATLQQDCCNGQATPCPFTCPTTGTSAGLCQFITCTTTANCCGGVSPCPYTCSGGSCRLPSICSNDSDCCGGGSASCEFQCVAQSCLRTPLAIAATQTSDAALSRLNECLGSSRITDYVTLGAEAICIWEDSGNPTVVCAGSTEDKPCPYTPAMGMNGQLDCSPGLLAGKVSKQVTKTLGLFDQRVAGGATDPCEAIRQLRYPSNKTIEERRRLFMSMGLAQPHVLSPQVLEEASKLIGWEPDLAGVNASVIPDGSINWSTKSQGTSPTAWPCKAYPYATTGTSGLFASNIDCYRPTQANATTAELQALAEMNQRLFEAALTVHKIRDGKFSHIMVPFKVPVSEFPNGSGWEKGQTSDRGSWLVDNYVRAQPTADPDIFALQRMYRLYDDPSDATATPAFWRFFSNTGTLTAPTIPAAAGPDATYWQQLRDEPPADGWGCWAAILGSLAQNKQIDFFPCLPSVLHGNPYLQTGDQFQWQEIHGEIPVGKTLMRSPLNNQDRPMFDALELMCEVTRGRAWRLPLNGTCPDFPTSGLTKPEDFDAVLNALSCQVTSYHRKVGGLVLSNVPTFIAEGLGDFAVNDGAPVVGGEIGEKMLLVKAALRRYGELSSGMLEAAEDLVATIQDMTLRLRQVQVRAQTDADQITVSQLRTEEAQVKIDQVDFQKQAVWSKAAISCIAAMARGVSDWTSFGGGIGAAAADCYASTMNAEIDVQALGYESRIASIEQSIAQNEVNQAQNNMKYSALQAARELVADRAKLRKLLKEMGDITREAQAGLDDLSAGIRAIENLRLSAQRAIVRATSFQSTQAATTENVDNVLSVTQHVAKRRYAEAHKNAVKLTFLAKRAIEQRLGVRLSDMRSDLPLVDAPSTWEGKICTASGVDYEAIRAAQKDSADAVTVETAYAGSFIGDYVTRLENLVESYRLDNDFREGTDEVVVSVRDDIQKIRKPCPVQQRNLLKYSGALDQFTPDSTRIPGWEIVGCPAGTPNASCFNVAPVPPGSGSVYQSTPLYSPSPVNAYGFTWGTGSTATLVQKIELEPGRYRLSWHSRDNLGTPPLRDVDAKVFGDTGAELTATVPSGVTSPDVTITNPNPSTAPWKRYWHVFDVTRPQRVSVTLAKGAGSPTNRWAAAVMLDRVGPVGVVDPIGSLPNPLPLSPPAFVATSSDLTEVFEQCEDTTGEAFRAKSWEYLCATQCPQGFNGACPGSSLSQHCYWETHVNIDHEDIEAGRIFNQSGFARGNFNYRIEDVAVNFVGTGVRDCAGSNLPSTCNSAGFLPYTISHLGPYSIRNYQGLDFNLKLFTGNIEHARGIALERYLTNPVSNTDRELLTPYIRSELKGRPFDGNFALRVWDEPGIDFNAIADVQLYVKYRYWTRFR